MELYEIKNGLDKAHLLIDEYRKSAQIDEKLREIEGLSYQTMQDDFWDDPTKAKKIYDELNDMKKIKILIAVLLSLCLAFAVTGCSGDNLKDSVINGFNDMLQHFSKYALTDEKDLQGDKTKGEDTYTGSYTADYEDFNDKEYIFGGTALERDKGSELTVTYELTVDSGTAKLYWLDKGEEKMIADTSKNGTYSVTLDEGDNYLTLEGNDFCGSLQVVVE